MAESGQWEVVDAASSISHRAAMVKVIRVTGMPTRACSRQVIRWPKRAAWSMTMMLAMLPTINRLPASVLDQDQQFHRET